jgi:hypothetical protein
VLLKTSAPGECQFGAAVQLVLIKFSKVVHGNLNSVHWSQITELASDLDSVDLRAHVINYFKGSSQMKDRKFGK